MSDDQLRDILRRLVALEREQRRPRAEVGRSGTFTPYYFGSTVAGTTTYTGVRYGYYIVSGGVCSIWLRLGWTATTATGVGLVGGLPLVAATDAEVVMPVLSQDYAYAGAGLRAYLFGGLLHLTLFDQVVGAWAGANVDAAATLIISGSYPV